MCARIVFCRFLNTPDSVVYFFSWHGDVYASDLWGIAFARVNSHAFKSFNALLTRRCPAVFFQLLGSQLETGNMVNLIKPQSARIVENALDFF